MKRKLVKIGNSLAVTLPRDMVKEMDLKPGMEVDATVDPRENGKASPRFKKMVDGLIRERRKLYERLS